MLQSPQAVRATTLMLNHTGKALRTFEQHTTVRPQTSCGLPRATITNCRRTVKKKKNCGAKRVGNTSETTKKCFLETLTRPERVLKKKTNQEDKELHPCYWSWRLGVLPGDKNPRGNGPVPRRASLLPQAKPSRLPPLAARPPAFPTSTHLPQPPAPAGPVGNGQ